MKCINKSHPEFKKLVEETGKNPFVLETTVGIWQSKNNTDRFPSTEELGIEDTTEVTSGQIMKMIESGEITYTDEQGNPCAKIGLTNTIKGTNWKVSRDFKGKPKHNQGGVDITISNKGVSMRKGGKEIKAAHGLLIPATIMAQDGLVVNGGDYNPIEYESMSKVLSQRNKSLNWVERGLNPDNYPKINNEDGTFSTHRLAYSTGDNGEAYVYPTIIQNDKGELEQLDNEAAWEYAKKTKTAMVVPSVKLAEYYSQNGLIKH